MSWLLDQSYISYLNLDHRADRLEHIQKELEKAGIEATRTRGKRPAEFDLTEQRLQVMKNRTPGAIGCYMGQIEIIEEAQRRGQHAMVLEDDCMFCYDFKERVAYIENFLIGKEWDIIWLGATFHVNPPWWYTGSNPDMPSMPSEYFNTDSLGIRRDAECTEDPRIIRTYACFCTYAYVVNHKSIQKALKMLEDLMPASMGIDWSMIVMQPSLKTYSFVPGCIRQIDNMSDIGNGMTVFSGFAMLGPYWYADKMNDFDPAAFNWAEAKNNGQLL